MTQPDPNLSLYLSHRAALVDYATPIVGSRANAEDVVQEAFLRFAPVAAQPDIENPLAYLYRIVRNLSLDVARRLASERRRTGDEAVPDDIPDLASNPEKSALHRDELRHVVAALAELPERTQRAFELHRLQDLTLQQTAATLGISTTLVHKLIRNALVACMQRLGTDDDA